MYVQTYVLKLAQSELNGKRHVTTDVYVTMCPLGIFQHDFKL